MSRDLNFYQLRLIRRELSLLAIYRNKGRQPRITQVAYWRASAIPFAVGVAFFISRYLGLDDTQSTMTAAILFGGLLLADMHLFVSNAPAWIFARQTIDWGQVARLHKNFVGEAIDLSQPPVKNRWDTVRVPQSYLKGIGGMYQSMANQSPTVVQVISQSPEFRVIGILTLLTVASLMLAPDFVGFSLSVYFFLFAWNAKRVKAAVDFHLTWPVLKHAFNWDSIRGLS